MQSSARAVPGTGDTQIFHTGNSHVIPYLFLLRIPIYLGKKDFSDLDHVLQDKVYCKSLSRSGLEHEFTNMKCHDREYSSALPLAISSCMLLSCHLEHDVFSSCSSQNRKSQMTAWEAHTPLPNPVMPHLKMISRLVASFLGIFDSLEEWQGIHTLAVFVQLGKWEERNTNLSSLRYQSRVRHAP